jgi:hypothetical protein
MEIFYLEMLVITKLMGGLGNQLFQYAMGRRLALRRYASLDLDLSFLHDSSLAIHTPRDYELGIFPNLAAAPLRVNEARLVQTTQLPYRLYNKMRRVLGLAPAFLYLGEGEYFTPNAIVLAGGPSAQLLHLEGYWQNECYFADIAAILRQELVFAPFADELNQAIAQRIQHSSRPTVSVHVRRGDYAQFTAFGMCSVDYYERALIYMQQHLVEPVFFVFSDDISWARENLPLPATTEFVDWNQGATSYRDMQLMSLCHNHVIANSSFSWWGAWLNPRPDKLVVAPQIWMAAPRVMTERVVPATWVRL